MTLLFEHIPKAAGNSVKAILRKHFEDEVIFSTRSGDPAALDEFRQLPVAERHRFELIMGHRAFELLDWCPADVRCFTMLRHPVERLVSLYYFARGVQGHYLHEFVTDGGMSLEEFASSDVTTELDNYMVCKFSGRSPEQVTVDPAGAFEEARVALDAFLVVGLTDHFDRSMDLLCRSLGWKGPPSAPVLNRTRVRPSPAEVSDLAVRTLRGRNESDLRLYTWAEERLDETDGSVTDGNGADVAWLRRSEVGR